MLWYGHLDLHNLAKNNMESVPEILCCFKILSIYFQRRYINNQEVHHLSLGKCRWKPHWDNTSYPLEWLHAKGCIITSFCEDLGKLEPSCFLLDGRIYNDSASLENICQSFTELNMELSYDPAIQFLSKDPEELKIETQRNACTYIFNIHNNKNFIPAQR